MERFCTFIGASGLLFGLFSAYWWLAHQLDWWTFALTLSGAFLFYEFAKIVFKDVNSTRNQKEGNGTPQRQKR